MTEEKYLILSYLKKVCVPRSKYSEVDDEDNNSDKEYKIVDDGDIDANDAEHEPLNNDQNVEDVSVIKSKDLMRNSNGKHLLSQILRCLLRKIWN